MSFHIYSCPRIKHVYINRDYYHYYYYYPAEKYINESATYLCVYRSNRSPVECLNVQRNSMSSLASGKDADGIWDRTKEREIVFNKSIYQIYKNASFEAQLKLTR